MASILTARLLAGDQNSVSHSRSRNSSPTTTTLGRNDNLSGYSADKEGSQAAELMGRLPCLIDLHHHRHKRKPAMDAEDRATKRKMNELCYDAATAKVTLKRAGRPYHLVGSRSSSRTAPTTTHRLRIAPFIDLSNVRLMHSNAVDGAGAEEHGPFVTSNATAACLGRYEILTDFGAAYQEMIHQTAAAYHVSASTSPRRSNSPASESGSSSSSNSNNSSSDSSSSLSDTESDDSCRSTATILVTTARLDDNRKISHDSTKFNRDIPRTYCISCPTTASIPMEDAIGVCELPRLVTLASPPYTVVFCNAAFAVSTGRSSDETLGKSLHDLLAPSVHPDGHDDDPEHGRVCLESCAASSSEGSDTSVCLYRTRDVNDVMNNDSNNESNNNNTNNDETASVKCGMKVLPIISRRMVPLKKGCDAIGDARELNNITHFSLELHLTARRNVPRVMAARVMDGPKYVTAMG